MKKSDGLSSIVYGSDNGGYGDAVKDMKQAIKDIKIQDEGIISKGWNGLKAAVKVTQKSIGVVLDTAGVAAKNIARVPVGLYY